MLRLTKHKRKEDRPCFFSSTPSRQTICEKRSILQRMRVHHGRYTPGLCECGYGRQQPDARMGVNTSCTLEPLMVSRSQEIHECEECCEDNRSNPRQGMHQLCERDVDHK